MLIDVTKWKNNALKLDALKKELAKAQMKKRVTK